MEAKSFFTEFLGQKYKVHYIKDASQAENALKQLMEKDCLFGFDLETMSDLAYRDDTTAPLDPLRSKPRLVQICDGKNILVFDLLFGCAIDIFRGFLSSKRLIAHNAIFEIQHLLQNFKINSANVGCTYLATKLLHHALYVDDGGIGAGLDDVVQALFKKKLVKEIKHKYWYEPDLTFEQIEYAALDAAAVLRVADKLTSGINKYGLGKIYSLYKDAQWPLAKMQLNGIGIDKEKHLNLISTWRFDVAKAAKKVTKLTGVEKITGHTIAEYLEKKLDKETLALWPRTDTGKLSTDAHAFAEFDFLEIVKPFSEYQKFAILNSTFGMKLQHKINPVDGRIHAQYKLCGTRTGRLSSTNPNLQQMPHDPVTRSIFIPDKSSTFIVADFNQIELRIAAELSQDEEMLNAYRKGLDLHKLTAVQVSRRKPEDLTDDDRFKAKALNFGLLFGLGREGFKHYAKKQYKVDLSTNEAISAVDAWHSLYSGYSSWQKDQADICKNEMEVRTVTGKLRKLNEENYYGASANTQVQGAASEVMLNSLVRLYRAGFGDRLVNTIHDELIVETPGTKILPSLASEVNGHMVAGFLDVFPNGITKNLVKTGIGKNWAEAK